ncbi:MAG: hypothetical protein MZV49_12905 [Rhodopseudomonas palustris]|nr:hypothetical protein [Rhodopseudomonas palustris]
MLSGNRNFEGRIHPRRRGQLPGVAAAGGGLRPRRHASTSTSTASRSATDRDGQPVFLTRPLADARRRSRARRRRRRRRRELFREQYAERLRPATRAGSALPVPDGATLRLGRGLHLHPAEPPYFDGLGADAGAARRHRAARACWPDARRLGHHRPHLPGRRRSRPDSPAGRYLDGARASSRRTSTPTARGAATTRS